jgi:hypothetical protein
VRYSRRAKRESTDRKRDESKDVFFARRKRCWTRDYNGERWESYLGLPRKERGFREF